jgi:hypothetical protein
MSSDTTDFVRLSEGEEFLEPDKLVTQQAYKQARTFVSEDERKGKRYAAHKTSSWYERVVGICQPHPKIQVVPQTYISVWQGTQ